MELFASKKFRSTVLVSLVLLCSCSNEHNFVLIESRYNKTFVDINYDDLNKKINNKDNFLLYIYSSSCLSCADFKTLINNYISNNDVLVYGYNILNKDIEDLVNYKYTPTLVLFENGNDKCHFDQENNEKMFVSSNNLKEELNKYLKLSNRCEVILENDLENIILSDCLIYFYYSKCSDCNYFYEHFLKEEIEKDYFKKIYFFDMKDYFVSIDDNYKNFTKKYGLSIVGSNLGYKNGVVPTLQLRKNNEILENVIIYNDEFETKYKENNEIESIKIVNSYYKDNPYINKEFYSSERSAKEEYHKSTLNYYIDKVKNIIAKF